MKQNLHKMAILMVGLLYIFIFVIHASESNSPVFESKFINDDGYSDTINETDEYRMLYIVSIQWLDKEGNKYIHFCTASMLAPKFAITFMHCAVGIERMKLLYYVKKKPKHIVWVQKADSSNKGSYHNIDKVYCPKAENADTPVAYGILKLKSKVKAKGPEIDLQLAPVAWDEKVTMARWKIENNKLIRVEFHDLTTISREECQKINNNNKTISWNEVCALAPRDIGTYRMSSRGSPLIHRGKLMGVSSSDCIGRNPCYVVFSLLELYKNNINRVIKKQLT